MSIMVIRYIFKSRTLPDDTAQRVDIILEEDAIC